MIDNIKDSYIKWIKENTKLSKTRSDIVELSSPFLDAIDENIKIYIKPDSDEFKISDDGFTIWSLESSGISFRKGSSREKVLKSIVDRSGINISDDKELYIYVEKNNLGMAMHILIQSIISISDMLMYSKNTIQNLFFDEVNNYFNKHSDLYNPFPAIEITGKSKLSYRFDFLMNVKDQNKKLVNLINHIDQPQLERALISWEDTSKQREEQYDEKIGMVTLVNDKEKRLSSKYKAAFDRYGIVAIEFSDKELVKKHLSYVG